MNGFLSFLYGIKPFDTWMNLLIFVENFQQPIKVTVVYWKVPASGSFKLNIDGCSRGNPGVSGGGGLIRNSDRKVVFAFSSPFTNGLSLEAEVRLLELGLRLAKDRGFYQLHVETDSMLIVQIVKGVFPQPWFLHYVFQNLQRDIMLSITYIHTEGNLPVDFLANQGADEDFPIHYFTFSELPNRVRSVINLDRLGMPNLRCCPAKIVI